MSNLEKQEPVWNNRPSYLLIKGYKML